MRELIRWKQQHPVQWWTHTHTCVCVCVSREGFTQQAWVPQTLHIPQKGLVLADTWEVASGPRNILPTESFVCPRLWTRLKWADLCVDGDWARMSVSGAACLWNRPGHQAQEGCPGQQHFPRVVTYCCCRIKCRLWNSTGRGPPETCARFLLDSALPAFSLGWF